MSSIYSEVTGNRRDKSRTWESRQRTLQRRAIRYVKYGTDTRKAGR